MSAGTSDVTNPGSFAALEQILYPTCEAFLDAARRVAANEGISLTITHKSRNTPGKQASQYRGCLVLNCIEWHKGCSFEVKAYGPIDGGWRMRPLQHPGLKKHTVTSWAICNHPKVPLRTFAPVTATTWQDLLNVRFPGPDEMIDAVHTVARHCGMRLYLLTLMLSDGRPKPNGRDSTYIPRGFLTLECVEASNGCPFAIKCREEDSGWYIRPWREKGKSDLKGAVSTIVCKHGPEVAVSYRHKQAEKERKALAKANKTAASPASQQEEEEEHQHQHHGDVQVDLQAPSPPPAVDDNDLSSGLDPALMNSANDFHHALTSELSNEVLVGAIEHSFNSSAHPHLFGFGDSPFQFGTSESLTSSASTSYTPSVVDQFRSNLSSYPFVLASATPSSKRFLDDYTPSILTSRPAKRSRKSPTASNHHHSTNGSPPLGLSPPPTHHALPLLPALPPPPPPPPPAATTNHSLDLTSKSSTIPNVSWQTFLETLDPDGRLNVLAPALTKDGGIDPGAVVQWPPEDISEFVDEVASDSPAGVRIHFRVSLHHHGKRIWEELSKNVAEAS